MSPGPMPRRIRADASLQQSAHSRHEHVAGCHGSPADDGDEFAPLAAHRNVGSTAVAWPDSAPGPRRLSSGRFPLIGWGPPEGSAFRRALCDRLSGLVPVTKAATQGSGIQPHLLRQPRCMGFTLQFYPHLGFDRAVDF